MLRVLRSSRCLASPLAVALAAYVLVGTADWWHAWDDDRRADAVVAHDHSTHRPVLGSNGGAGDPDHCYICHWLRSLQNGFGLGRTSDLQTIGVRRSQMEPTRLFAELVAAGIPARAPPA
jgi:hypothetical protein